MLRKFSFMLALLWATVIVNPVLAQETASTANAVFLPVITASPQTVNAVQAETDVEVDLTDTVDSVEAAGHGSSGAVYVSTNAAPGNEVIVYQRTADGTLAQGQRFATGGLGSGNGLGSQGALISSNNGRWLFVVNAGSNEISVFAVEGQSLRLTDKVASGGVLPTSLTVRKNVLYVLNAGDPGNITGFRLQHDGKLTPLANSRRWLSNNGSGAAPAPAQVSFSPDGDFLVVTERTTNRLDTYQVNKHGLVTASAVHASAGMTPFGFAFADDETFVVSEAFGGAVNGSAASSYELEDDGLELISASVPTNQTAACWIVISNDGKYAYSTNAGSASLSGYRIGKKGALTLLNARAGETGAGTGPTDATLSRNGRYLYALSPRSQNIIGFAIQADGSLLNIGAFAGLPAGTVGIAAR
jgi:6-phosphogluconolactonase (cycloisomerase 2 family)